MTTQAAVITWIWGLLYHRNDICKAFSKYKSNCIAWMNKFDHISIILFIHESYHCHIKRQYATELGRVESNGEHHFKAIAQTILDFKMQINLKSFAIGNNIRFDELYFMLSSQSFCWNRFGCCFKQINNVGAILFTYIHIIFFFSLDLAPSGRLQFI